MKKSVLAFGTLMMLGNIASAAILCDAGRPMILNTATEGSKMGNIASCLLDDSKRCSTVKIFRDLNKDGSVDSREAAKGISYSVNGDFQADLIQVIGQDDIAVCAKGKTILFFAKFTAQ